MSRRRRKKTPTAKKHAAKAPEARKQAPAARAHSPRAHSPPWAVLGLAGVGLLITLYLTVVAWWGGTPALCTPGSGCDVIQQSRWSTVLGMPLSLWGFAMYALIAWTAWRLPPGLRRWRRLWNLSLIGLGISLYLTAVGIVALNAVCGWCLASLATMAALFAVVAVRRPGAAPGMAWRYWALNSGVLALFAVGVLHAHYSGLLDRRENPRLQALAMHLDESGARYYGAFWCGSCQEQNRLFGAAAERLPYTECTPDGRGGRIALACLNAEVGGYPTWIIGGRRLEGVIPPEELARYSGFDWEGWEPAR